jgi:hypothetical protein
MRQGECKSSMVRDCYEFGENAVADITRRRLAIETNKTDEYNYSGTDTNAGHRWRASRTETGRPARVGGVA